MGCRSDTFTLQAKVWFGTNIWGGTKRVLGEWRWFLRGVTSVISLSDAYTEGTGSQGVGSIRFLSTKSQGFPTT